MCLPLECFIGRRFKEDPHGGSLPKGSSATHHTGSVAAKPTTQYYPYPAPAERNGHHTNGYNKAPAYNQQKHSVAAVEEAHKAANDWRKGHNYNWPAAGAGAGAVGQERAYVHSGTKGKIQTQPAMKAMVAVDGAAYPYPNYGHRQEYYRYN